MTGDEARAFLEEMFAAVFDPAADSDVTDRYFTEDYVQVVDDVVLDRAAFDAHLTALRAAIETVSFDFTTVVAEGDRIAEIHIVTARKRDGGRLRTKLVAHYWLRDGKIARLEELTRMLEGAPVHADLGSRT